ncbi:hypothetical protein [Paracoccus pacificus]|uniref:Uncharacterized protein n=1 Tax=Paracoccus pacificus TaxID=1463598 RepID=A0ABW4R7N9_9RHOB
MIYELRDHPDDLPILCKSLAEARKRARARAARFGIGVLIYERLNAHHGIVWNLGRGLDRNCLRTRLS